MNQYRGKKITKQKPKLNVPEVDEKIEKKRRQTEKMRDEGEIVKHEMIAKRNGNDDKKK